MDPPLEVRQQRGKSRYGVSGWPTCRNPPKLRTRNSLRRRGTPRRYHNYMSSNGGSVDSSSTGYLSTPVHVPPYTNGIPSDPTCISKCPNRTPTHHLCPGVLVRRRGDVLTDVVRSRNLRSSCHLTFLPSWGYQDG